MEIIPLLLKEMKEEAAITRKFFERLPEDQWTWKPHEKSMDLKGLAVHLAELPSWVTMALNTSELDFSKMDYKPTEVQDKAALIKLHEDSLQKAKDALATAKEDDLLPTWVLRNGDTIYNTMTKYEVMRHSFSQTTHHRAQLGVYLRLLNIPVPGSYGPSADEGFA